MYYINGVPFFKQNAYQCGPSALASALNFYGKKLSPQEITDTIKKEEIKGTLNLELLIFPRRYGLITEMLLNDIEKLREYIKNKVPVLLLVDNGFSIYRIPHYILIIGFDENNDVFVAHWGNEGNKIVSSKELKKRWLRMGGWGFAIFSLSEEEMSSEQLNDTGVAMEFAEDLPSAERYYNKALEKNPKFCEPLFNLGNIYFKQGNFTKSEEFFLKSLDVCEKKADIYNNLAYVLHKIGRKREAVEYIEKALMLEPANPEYLDTKKRITE